MHGQLNKKKKNVAVLQCFFHQVVMNISFCTSGGQKVSNWKDAL